MKNILQLLFLTLLILFGNRAIAQYEFVKLTLEIEGVGIDCVNVSMGRGAMINDSSTYCIIAQSFNLNKEVNSSDTTWITIDKFNEIAQLAMSISSVEILKGMAPASLTLYEHMKRSCTLNVGVGQGSIKYQIPSPMSDIKKRNLNTLVKTCEELLKAANLEPRHMLKYSKSK